MNLVKAAVFASLFFLLAAMLGCVQQDGNIDMAGESNAGKENLFPNPDRGSYGIGVFVGQDRNPVERPVEGAFVNLPAMPPDFGEKMHSLEGGNFNPVAMQLGESYFKQPEFLPTFKEIGLGYWRNPNMRMFGREGFGVYPADGRYAVKAGKETYAVVFVHSAYGIETFQGMRLEPVLTEEQAEIFSVEIEPESVLLGPTYPVIDGNWMHRVVVKITAKEELKQGEQSIAFWATVPEPLLDEFWAKELGTRYVSGKSMFSIGRPALVIGLKKE